MRVGIDARFLTHPQRGGFKTYTRALVSSIASVDKGNDYIIYTDRRTDESFDLPRNFRITPVKGNAIAREQVYLPKAMTHDKVDVAHFLYNTAPVRLDAKMVITIHDTIPLRSSGRSGNLKHQLLQLYWRKLMPVSAQKADMAITNSEYVSRDIQATLGLHKSLIRLAPMPIDRVFSPTAEGTPPKGIGKPFVLAFASPDGRKNHQAAIDAYRLITDRYPGLTMALVCSHPRVREAIGQTYTGVLPVGPVSTQELVWLFRNAEALIFPSFDEGFGLPPLEAMACGTPVIASNAGSLPEALGGCAIQVEPTDVEGLANGLKQVLSGGEPRETMVRKGLEWTSHFTLENMGQELVEAYTNVKYSTMNPGLWGIR